MCLIVLCGIMAQRLTLISDATNEFPNNKNNSFRMRIPNGLHLQGEGWHVALLSLTLPNRTTHQFATGHGNTIIRFQWTAVVFSGNSGGKYTTAKLVYFAKTVMESDIASSSDGVAFWNNIKRTLDYSVDDQLVTHKKANIGHDVFVKETMCPTFAWDGDELVIHRRGRDVTNGASSGADLYSAVDIALEVAVQWGIVQQNDDGAWVAGPNLRFTPFMAGDQINNAFPPRIDGFQIPGNLTTLNGDALRLQHRLDIPVVFGGVTAIATGANNLQLLWYYKAGSKQWIRLTGMMEWRISNIKQTYYALHKHPNHSVMVYSNLQQATIVGEKTVQLLREIVVNRSAEEGHSYAEPKQLQWIPIASRHMDIAEVQLADVNGALLSLPPGKSLVTVACKQMI